MTRIQSFVITLWNDRRGQDFVEYALLVGFAVVCAVSCLPAISATGTRLGQIMQSLFDTINRISAAG